MRVYLSSTFKDLEAHRAAVLTALRRADFDCSAMEDYTAADDRPAAFCLKDVARCDVYVGIYAHRIGFRPAASNIAITEMEYRHAEQQGIPRLVFVIDKHHPWPDEFWDTGEDAAHLAAFKRELQLELTGDRGFTTPDDLAARVVAALRRHESTGARSWRQGWNPIDFGPYLAEKRREFCGREWLFERLETWRKSAAPERALLIKGDPGTGTSAIIAELVRRNLGGIVLAHHCCQWDDGEKLRPGRFVRSITAMIAENFAPYADLLERDPALREKLSEANCETDPASALENGLFVPLATLIPEDGERRFLLIDALDEALLVPAGSRSIVDLLATRLGRLPPWLRIVATTRKEPEIVQRLRSLRAEELDAQSPENLNDLRQFLEGKVRENVVLSRQLPRGVSQDETVQTILRNCDGNFLYAAQVVEGLERNLLSLADIDHFPPGLNGLYENRFSHEFPNAVAFERPRKLFELFAAAEEPLTESQLAAATGWDEEEELLNVLHQIAAYAPPLPSISGKRSYAIFHKSLTDWLTSIEQRGRTHYASLKRGHFALAEVGTKEYQRSPQQMSPYMLAHLPAHHIGAKQWNEVESLLTDLEYLEARVQTGQTFDLAATFTAANRAIEEADSLDADRRRILRLLEEGLRRDMQFIVRHAQDYPQALFQSLWNNGWWYDCPIAASHHEVPVGGWETPPLWEQRGLKLSTVLEHWRANREDQCCGFRWLRAIRPPALPLGSALHATWRGHEERVTSVSWSPDGRWLATGSDDRKVRIWDAQTGAKVGQLTGHRGGIYSVTWSPDSQQIATGSSDRTVRIWNAQTGARVAKLVGHERGVRSVAWSPNGQWIATGSSDQTAQIWNAQTSDKVAQFTGHQDWVVSVAWSPDGQRLATGSNDRTMRIWDTQTTTQISQFSGHQSGVRSVSWSPDGRWLATGSDDRTVRIWDAQTGAKARQLTGHQGGIYSVTWSPDSQQIATGSSDRTARIWDAHTGTKIAQLSGHERSIRSIAWSPSGLWIATGSSDRTVRIWDGRSEDLRVEVAQVVEHQGEIHCVAWSPDGHKFATSSNDRTVGIWDGKTGVKVSQLYGHQGSVYCVAWSPDGRQLATGSSDRTVGIWDLETCTRIAKIIGHESGVRNVAWSPDGRHLATGSNDQTVRIWDVEKLSDTSPIEQEQGMTNATWSPDGGRVATESSEDMSVLIWDAEMGTEVARLASDGSELTGLAWSSDGRSLATESNGKVLIWDVSSGKAISEFLGRCDLEALVATDSVRFFWAHLPSDPWDTAIIDSNQKPLAWWGESISHLAANRNEYSWAGSTGNHLTLFTLEGHPTP